MLLLYKISAFTLYIFIAFCIRTKLNSMSYLLFLFLIIFFAKNNIVEQVVES